MQDNFNDDVCILNQDLLAVESFFGKGGRGVMLVVGMLLL